MVTKLFIKDMAEFLEYSSKVDPKGPVVLFSFTGAKLPSGKSWCGDCNDAEPIIEAFLSEVKQNIIFAYVDVGNAEYWRKRDCPFRTHPKLKLMVIPTIIRWNGVQRLEGEQCCNRELLQMLIEEEE